MYTDDVLSVENGRRRSAELWLVVSGALKCSLANHSCRLITQLPSRRRYVVKELLGQGTFGQVVKCIRQDMHEAVAVKVIKNQTAFYHQVSILEGSLAPTNHIFSIP